MGNVTPGSPRRPRVGSGREALSEGIFDAYEVGEMLGSGTFAQVRKCWPLDKRGAEDEYAVKIVDTMSEVFRQASSFISARQEANILQGLRHPHIVDLVHVFQKERWLFLVLEIVPGGELFSALANPNLVVTEACVATTGRQLLLALEYLHDQAVVHRDVKAENIMLTSNPAESSKWHIKLVDFGLAMRVEQPPCMFDFCRNQEMPLEELICGTAYYCAPEVWINDYSHKVDVWAAGVVLYLALHGTFPFYDSDAGRLEGLICDPDKAPPFRAVCRNECPGYEVSAGARELLTALLHKEQDDRPAAAEARAMPWFRAAGGSGKASNKKKTSALLGGGSAGGAADGDAAAKVVPQPIRAKAGRAAQRPLVDPNKEQSRTRALELMQRRASVASRGPSAASACEISEMLRSPAGPRRGRELGHDPSSSRGQTARLALMENEGTSSEVGSTTDSDPEEGFFTACSCP